MTSEKVLIVGLGLLGASLGMALRPTSYVRCGWARREETRLAALELDVVTICSDDLAGLLAEADLTVLALPVPDTIRFLEQHAAEWRPGSVVTDIGSVKLEIMQAAERFLTPCGVRFVGSHPMAGTEKSGLANSFSALYENADVFICPPACGDEEAVATVERMWRSVGTHCVRIEPRPHDMLVAHTSHVPHILASALSLSVLGSEEPEEKARRFAGCATGFRDTSRIASSNPVMWREIIEHNREAVLAAMADYDVYYEAFREMIRDGRFDDFEALFGRGRDLRDSWLKYKEWKK